MHCWLIVSEEKHWQTIHHVKIYYHFKSIIIIIIIIFDISKSNVQVEKYDISVCDIRVQDGARA